MILEIRYGICLLAMKNKDLRISNFLNYCAPVLLVPFSILVPFNNISIFFLSQAHKPESVFYCLSFSCVQTILKLFL